MSQIQVKEEHWYCSKIFQQFVQIRMYPWHCECRRAYMSSDFRGTDEWFMITMMHLNFYQCMLPKCNSWAWMKWLQNTLSFQYSHEEALMPPLNCNEMSMTVIWKSWTTSTLDQLQFVMESTETLTSHQLLLSSSPPMLNITFFLW